MKKEFNAETATPAEAIVATYEFEIENVGDDEEQKKNIALNIGDAVKNGYINSGDAKKLLKRLGVEPPKDDAPFTMDDAVAFNKFLREQNEELRSAKLKVEDLKAELKEAKKIVAQYEAMILSASAEGAKDFKAKNRTLFDGLEDNE